MASLHVLMAPGSTRNGLTRLVSFWQEMSSSVSICGILGQLIIAIVSKLGCQHCICLFAVLCALSVLGALHAHALWRLSLPVCAVGGPADLLGSGTAFVTVCAKQWVVPAAAATQPWDEQARPCRPHTPHCSLRASMCMQDTAGHMQPSHPATTNSKLSMLDAPTSACRPRAGFLANA